MRISSERKSQGDYSYYTVEEEGAQLLEWLLRNVKGSRSKIKSTLQGRGIRV